MGRRAGFTFALAVLAALACVPSSALASFHENRISEVFPGTIACPECAFVELQSFAAGQNFVGGHMITFFDKDGLATYTSTMSANVANGETQRRIVIADSSPPDAITADFTDTAIRSTIFSSGGAACFEALDCVAWGDITPLGLAALPSPAGTPVAAGGIPDGSSIVRGIAAGCPTFFEGADDTNTSATDFAVSGDPSPRPNSVTPTETTCTLPTPQTVIDKGPPKKVEGRKVTFKFSSPNTGSTFECKLDDKPFSACESPLKLGVKPGKHSFGVRAVLNGVPDPSPATYTFKRAKPTKHRPNKHMPGKN